MSFLLYDRCLFPDLPSPVSIFGLPDCTFRQPLIVIYAYGRGGEHFIFEPPPPSIPNPGLAADCFSSFSSCYLSAKPAVFCRIFGMFRKSFLQNLLFFTIKYIKCIINDQNIPLSERHPFFSWMIRLPFFDVRSRIRPAIRIQRHDPTNFINKLLTLRIPIIIICFIA